MKMPIFNGSVLESLCDVLGDTQSGLTGTEIGHIMSECDIADHWSAQTKRRRLYYALKLVQDDDRCGNHIVAFIERAMNPVRYVQNQGAFEERRARLNDVLVFQGLSLREDGRLYSVQQAGTISEARIRAASLRKRLLAREVHGSVLEYCKEELLVDNYFHVVLEASKSVFDRVRGMTGLTSDGSDLVDEAFGLKSGIPNLALNTLQTESERSEQKGYMNLLKGLYGAFRNPTAHAPKITWPIGEQDALDILSLISLVHRRLDGAVSARKVSQGGS